MLTNNMAVVVTCRAYSCAWGTVRNYFLKAGKRPLTHRLLPKSPTAGLESTHRCKDLQDSLQPVVQSQ